MESGEHDGKTERGATMPVDAPERPAGALFRALRGVDVAAESAYDAVEEVRDMAGSHVVGELGARIDRSETELGARIDRSETELGARIDALSVRNDETKSDLTVRIDRVESELGMRIDRSEAALSARIDTLQRLLWPLVIALCATLLSAAAGGLFLLFNTGG